MPREGWVMLDNVWVKTISSESGITYDLYVNETKLNFTTALTQRQTQFLTTLNSGVKQFTTRSVKDDIARVLKQGSTVNIKSFVKTMSNGSVNGPLLTVKLY